MLAVCISASATGFSQKVTLSMENSSLKQVFKEIKKQTGYTFAYREVLLQKTGKVSVHISGGTIQQVLDICFQHQPLTYSVFNNHIIVIKEKEERPDPRRGAQTPVTAAPIIITGKVYTSAGAPLTGASIHEKGRSGGIMTKDDGSFEITVEGSKSILVISYVGYESKEILVGGQTAITVRLSLASTAMNDIVVVGYGTQRKSDLTGAVTTVKGTEITKIGGSNAAEALQGKAPGVEVLSQGGPGSAPLVYVRGLGTNGDASPLYVVDGMMVSSIVYLAPGDIASVEILKDASATAIYGSRGANGVILITTKKGRTGKPVINFNTTHGFQYLTRKYDVANSRQYAQLVNLFNTNAGKPAVYNNLDSIGAGTNWIKEVTQPGMVHDYSLSASGGSENSVYNLSASYHKEDGIFKYTKFDRLTLRSNNDYKLIKEVSIGHDLAFSMSNYWGNAQWNGGRGINSIYRISPLLPVRKTDGSFTPGQDPDIINPYAALYYNKDVHTTPYQIVGNAYINWKVINGLTFRSSYGIDYTNNRINSYTPAFNVSSPNQIQANNSLESGYETKFTWLWENTLTYDKVIHDDHHLNLLAGYTAQNYDYNIVDLTGSNLLSTDPNFRYIQAVSMSNMSINTTLPTSESILSYLFRANYTYKERYLLTASIRADGSSKFADGHRWGNFPSVALGWNVSKENFMHNVEWVDNLKLRGSWGQIGNNKIANYQTYSLLTVDPVYSGVFNGVFYNDATITGAANPSITWEVSEQKDLGLEFATFKDRLKIEADYYDRKTKNLLLVLPIPGGSTGFSPAYSNAGTVRNNGLEFSIAYQENHRDFSYGVKLNGAINRNKVLNFGGQTAIVGDWMINSQHLIQAGYPIGDFYGYKVAGIAQSQKEIDALNAVAVQKSGVANKQYWNGLKPGDLIFQDIKGQGWVDQKDQTDIGSPYPKFIGGLTLNAAYKGFDFTIDLMGSFGAKIYNNARNQILVSGVSNMNVEWLNSWTPTNTNANMPRYAANSSASAVSDFNIQSGDYLKARFIELGYTFRSGVFRRAGLNSLRLYADAINAFYITKYKGFSPEVSNGYSVSTIGDDFRTYPVTGMAKVGLTITF